MEITFAPRGILQIDDAHIPISLEKLHSITIPAIVTSLSLSMIEI